MTGPTPLDPGSDVQWCPCGIHLARKPATWNAATPLCPVCADERARVAAASALGISNERRNSANVVAWAIQRRMGMGR